MQITVPTNLSAHPMKIIVDGVTYSLGGGETVDVPASVVYELNRVLGVKIAPDTPAQLPAIEPATKAALDDLDDRLDVQEALLAVKGLPDFPSDDGTYTLQLVMDDGVATLSWEAAEAAAAVDNGGGAGE